MSKVIVVDMDDTLVDLLPTWLNILNARYNTNVKVEDVTEWDMSKAFPNLTPTQIYGVLVEKALWSNVGPKHYAVEYLKALYDEGNTIYVATSSHYRTVATKLEESLLCHFSFLTYKDVIIIDNKSIIQCDYIVDDNPDKLRDSKAIKFLMDMPHNRDTATTDYDFRVSSMKEVYMIIKELQTTGYIFGKEFPYSSHKSNIS